MAKKKDDSQNVNPERLFQPDWIFTDENRKVYKGKDANKPIADEMLKWFFPVIKKSGDKAQVSFHRDVPLPLHEQHYKKPIICREYPFQENSREDELHIGLAASLLSDIPLWRSFKLWPDHRVPEFAYAELRRLLIEYGYSPKDFEKCSIAEIERLLTHAKHKEDSITYIHSLLLKEGYSGPMPTGALLSQFAGMPIDEVVKIFIRVEKEKSKIQKNGGENETDLNLSNIFKEPIEKLIEKGECHYIEFKATLEYDIKKNQRNKDLNKECLKTIVAFLNTDGGVLLIGIKDDGTIFGIEEDLKHVKNNKTDGFELKLRDLIQNYIKPFPHSKIEFLFEKFNQATVCRVNVEPLNRNQIVYLEESIYIRDGNRTINLKGTLEIANWIQQRGNIM